MFSSDGLKLATYEWGDPDGPVVIAVHGFASSAVMNFFRTGWTRDLTRAGFRVIGVDLRGHGASDKPHRAEYYKIERFVADILDVLDAYMIGDAQLVGYSLGARVGWQVALDMPDRISRAVLGGIPDGQPLTRFRTDQALAYLTAGEQVTDQITSAYLSMATAVADNDLHALIALVEGTRGGLQPDPANPPSQPILFATGSNDAIIERSRALAEAAPRGTFYEIPDRHHFNAPTSKDFREAAIAFSSIAVPTVRVTDHLP
jgi:pimeloyl-ACP methyl ester carboxylesterase